MLLYSQDFDDALVQANYSGGGATASTPTTPNCQPNGSNVVSYRWMDAIFPYVKVESLFNCPSTIPKTVQPYHYCGGTDNGTGLKNTGATVWGSYGINYAYRGGIPFSNGVGAVGPSFLNLKMSAVEAASETVWVADGVGSGSVNSANFNWACILTDSTTPPAISTTDPRTLAAMLAERHLNTADVLYMDGHVKAVSLDTLAATKTYTKSGHTYTNVATAFTIAAD